MRITRKLYSSGEMAQLARCSLGQLDYLKEIGLVAPDLRSREGHERYDDVNLLRLQQVRIGRARGLALEEIRRWLDTCAHGLMASERLGALAAARQATLYLEADVKAETNEDRIAFQREAATLYAQLSDRHRAGVPAIDVALRAWVERHHCHINRWFRACATGEHVAFGRALIKNPYHAANIERHGRDLTSFMLRVLEAHAR